MTNRSNPSPQGEPDLFSFAEKRPAPKKKPDSKPEPAKAAEPAILTVAQLTKNIKGQLSGLGKLAVEGEVTQIRVPASGHIYFSLKGEGAVISCAIWRSRTARALNFEMKEGMSLVVHGALDVYAPRGGYSLIVERVEQRGIGALLAQLEELKTELREKGWFDRSRPLPTLPQCVGVVTSRDSAAFQDFLRTRSLRWAGYPVRIAHAAVQGAGAAVQIASAIERLDKSGVDLIVVCRGGGSLEDLWCFNERPVAEAIHACSVPVVSGVGHEVDVSLADFVADHRAHTPTDAAVMVIPEKALLEEELERIFGYLGGAIDRCVTERSVRLQRAGNSRVLRDANWMLEDRAQGLSRSGVQLNRAMRSARERCEGELARSAHRLFAQSPALRVERQSVRLETASVSLARRAQRTIEAREQRLLVAERSLEAVSPLAVLERGYSVTLKDGKPVRDAAQLAAGDELVTRLHKGEVTVRVEETSTDESA